MAVRAGAALMLAAGLLIGPVAALYCDVRDAASMACCKGDMAGCNQPRKTEDCCKKSSVSHETALDLVQSHRLDKPAPAPHHHVALVAHRHAAGRLGPSSVLPGITPAFRSPPSPPLRAILRI